jgi:hypothetical protein
MYLFVTKLILFGQSDKTTPHVNELKVKGTYFAFVRTTGEQLQLNLLSLIYFSVCERLYQI